MLEYKLRIYNDKIDEKIKSALQDEIEDKNNQHYNCPVDLKNCRLEFNRFAMQTVFLFIILSCFAGM